MYIIKTRKNSFDIEISCLLMYDSGNKNVHSSSRLFRFTVFWAFSFSFFLLDQQVAFVPTFHFQMGSQNSAPSARVSCRDLRHDWLPLTYNKRSGLLVYFQKFLVNVLIPFFSPVVSFSYG